MCNIRIWTVVFYFLVFFKCMTLAKSEKKVECGYKQCPQTRDGALNVHLIPHSHMDAGWVKTFDEYYYGTKTQISSANVQLIYHSVLSELLHDKKRKFTFSEVGFFWRWWKEQRPATRAIFRNLVHEGRVEFAGGGWVQNDEATVDYLAIIDLYTWGLRKLNDTLGPCGKPKSAWQIDTYGHTREQSSLLAQMGFDGLFISRVDHKQRDAMIEDDRMEFMWRGSDALGKMSDIMTHTLFNLYNPPEGFCFDYLCNDEPINDDTDSRVYNADKRVNDFIAHIERQAKYYDHDNIVVMMGGDFTYQSAATWFMNMDKLINHVNSHPANLSDINIFYSTPSCYLKAIYLYGRRDKAVYTERGDHIPYGTDENTYWTGYYTSRPAIKYLIRKTHEFLQVFKQLTVITRMPDSYELHLLRHTVALVHHHDAITGTTQQHVTDDFVRMLAEATSACTRRISVLLSYLTPSWGGSRRPKTHQQFVMCHDLNISQCSFAETQETFMILLYNPSSLKTYHYVRLPAAAMGYSIKDANDEEVEHQLVPLPPAILSLPGRKSAALQELFFEAENIPAMGYSAFYVNAIHDVLRENELSKKIAAEEERDRTPIISNEYIKVTLNKASGLLESIQHNEGVKIMVSQNFFYYRQVQAALNSGAYSFRPGLAVPVAEKVSYTTVKGTLIREIKQKFSDWVTQVIRLYRGEEFVEFEWIVGPVPIGADLGKEVVTRYSTNITNDMEFYTDSNGRQMMRRNCANDSQNPRLERRSLPSCYYPISSRICMQSANASVGMCVLTDRTQGGTAYNLGEIEMMVHRRLLTDDGFGLEESLNEEVHGAGLVVRGKHRIFFGSLKGNPEDQPFEERASALARRWRYEPWPFFVSGERINRRKWSQVRNKRYSALHTHSLPRHVHILTLEPWKSGTVLLRLENTMEKNAKEQHITVDLRKLFLQLRISSFRETTLAANQWLDEARQMDWSTRYVYNGGTDGVQPEDEVDYRFDTPRKEEADRTQSSEEDIQTHRPRQKSYVRTKKEDYENVEPRKRRSITNTTVEILENNDNETVNIFPKITPDDTDIQTTKVPTKAINKNVSAAVPSNKVNKLQVAGEMYPEEEKEIKKPTGKQRNNRVVIAPQRKSIARGQSRGIVTSIGKPSKTPPSGWDDSDEYADYVEEVYEQKRMPKRNRNWRQNRKPEKHDNDEEITKSIYEMYYKNKRGRFNTSPTKIYSSEEYDDPPIALKKRSNKQQRRRFYEEHTDHDDSRENRRASRYSSRRSAYHKRRKGAMGLPRERNHIDNRKRHNITEDEDGQWEDDLDIENRRRGKEDFESDNLGKEDSEEETEFNKRIYSAKNRNSNDKSGRREKVSRPRSRIHQDYDNKEELNPLELEEDYSERKSISRRPRMRTRSKRFSMPYNTYNNKPGSSSVLRTRLVKTKKSPNGAFVPFFITDDGLIRRVKDEEKSNFRESIRRAEEESDIVDVNDMYVKNLDTNAWRNEYEKNEARDNMDDITRENDRKIQELFDLYAKMMMTTAVPEKKKYNIFDDEEKFIKNMNGNNAEHKNVKGHKTHFVEKVKNNPGIFRLSEDKGVEFDVNLKADKNQLDAENVYKERILAREENEDGSEDKVRRFSSEEAAKGNGDGIDHDRYFDEVLRNKRKKRNKQMDTTSDSSESITAMLDVTPNLKVIGLNKEGTEKTFSLDGHGQVYKKKLSETFNEQSSFEDSKAQTLPLTFTEKLETEVYETTTDQETHTADTINNIEVENRNNETVINDPKPNDEDTGTLGRTEFDNKNTKHISKELNGEEVTDESEEKLSDVKENFDDNEDRGGENLARRRKKRNPRMDMFEGPERDPSGHEYLITLRPTQIRTFVVWFEDIRKQPL